MAEQHHEGEHGHGGNLFRLYMIIAVVLAVCTTLSFVFNSMARAGMLAVFLSFLAILTVAIIKAVLVGMYFMHLKWDWKYLYFLIIPVFIMGTMMMTVLLPDIFIGPYKDAAEHYQIEQLTAEQHP